MITISPDTKRQKLATRYALIRRWLVAIQIILVLAIFLILVFVDISPVLHMLAPVDQPWASAVYFIELIIALNILMLPLMYYEGFVLPHRFNLSTQSLRSWITDSIKASALILLVGEVILIVIYTLLLHVPNVWWLWASMLVLAVSVLVSMLTPTAIIPLFYGIKPLNDEGLKKRLSALATKAQTRVSNVYTMNVSSKSTTANAMLAGIGRTRRIILTDTLLDNYSPDEIEAVLAHELGHNIHRDIPKLLAINAFIIVAGFGMADIMLRACVIPLGYTGIADVRGMPLMILMFGAFSFFISPALNAISRGMEMNADITALELTRNPQAFISAMTKLTDQNLSEAQPNRIFEVLFHDHPAYIRRVELAQHFIQKDEKEMHH